MRTYRITIPRGLVTALLILSFIGFLDSAYLSAVHFTGGIPYCTFLEGCEVVTTGPYANLGPIPIAYLGMLYYSLVFVLVVAYGELGSGKILGRLLIVTAAGLLFSLWLIFLQIFVVKAYCLYCLVSAGTAISLFVLSVVAFLKSEVEFI